STTRGSILALGALAACSTDSTPSTSSSTAAGDTDAFPVTIEHALGGSVIEDAPKSVATVSWANQDAAIALGVVPVAMPFSTYGGDENGYLPWTLEALEELGDERPTLFSDTDGIPFDELELAGPDLILGTYSGMSEDDYAQLSKIAPTTAYPEVAWGTDWIQQLDVTGRALGLVDEADALKTQIEDDIAAAVEAAPEIKGKTFAYLSFSSTDPSTVTYYTTADSRVEFVESLGLVSAPSIVELSEGNDQFFGEISAELADTIDADHLAAVTADPLLSKIPAVASGAIVQLDDPTFILSTSAPSPLSIPWAVSKYVPLIQEATTHGTRSASPRRAHAPRRGVLTLGLVVCVGVVVLVALVSVAVGARQVPLPQAWEALTAYVPGDIAHEAVRSRIPRTLLGLLVGASLGLAGALMQGLTRNPIADPGILGVNAGASMFVVLGIVVLGVTSPAAHVWFAFAGAAVAAVAVYWVASFGRGGATPVKLALAGTCITAALTSLITALLIINTRAWDTFRFWQVGSVSGRSLDIFGTVLPYLLVGMVVALVSGRVLNALSLGDDLARGLGQHVALSRGLAAVGVVLLYGGATAAAGPVAFVGLTVPHVARAITGPDYRWVLPYSALLGAGLVVVADVLGRIVAHPGQLQVGIVTAFIGAPVFIALGGGLDDAVATVRAARRRRTARSRTVTVVLAALAVGLVVLTLCVGAFMVSFVDVVRVIGAADFAGAQLFGETRLPVRIITGVVDAPFLLWLLA
ncbi:FecCD transport family-domain-containing protein, partial [Podospora conica]